MEGADTATKIKSLTEQEGALVKLQLEQFAAVQFYLKQEADIFHN